MHDAMKAEKSVVEELRELREQMAAAREAAKAESELRHAAINRQLAANDKMIAELGRQVGGLGNTIGRAFENSIVDYLHESRELCGIAVSDIHPNMASVAHGCEFDIVVTNCKYLLVVEAKHNLTVRDVREFAAKRLPLFAVAYPQMVAGRELRGAMVYQRTPKGAKAVAAALKAGLYVLSASSGRQLRHIKTLADITEAKAES